MSLNNYPKFCRYRKTEAYRVEDVMLGGDVILHITCTLPYSLSLRDVEVVSNKEKNTNTQDLRSLRRRFREIKKLFTMGLSMQNGTAEVKAL